MHLDKCLSQYLFFYFFSLMCTGGTKLHFHTFVILFAFEQIYERDKALKIYMGN
jgi:hypothetical protein